MAKTSILVSLWRQIAPIHPDLITERESLFPGGMWRRGADTLLLAGVVVAVTVAQTAARLWGVPEREGTTDGRGS